MSHETMNQSNIDEAESSEKSIKDKASFYWALAILMTVLTFGIVYLAVNDFIASGLGFFVLLTFGALGFFFIAQAGAEERKLAKLRSERCPQCKSWNSYHLKNSEVINSWGQWEMRDFVDRTHNAKGDLIATTTRKQQVWVDYVRRRYTQECIKCGHSHSWEALD